MSILPLSQVSCQKLEEIFRQELSYWRNELFWDYGPAIRLIRKHISSKSLPGCAICNGAGVLLGYGYYIINETVAYIGNLYVRSESATSLAYAELVGAILDEFRMSTKIRRIEGQLFPFNCDLVPLFRAHRFTASNRYFLPRTLEERDREIGPLNPPPDIRIISWSERFFTQAAAAIYDSYRDSPDFSLCHDYQSYQGCIRFLRNLIQNPGCGIFSPDTSYLAVDTNGQVCGILVSSELGPDTGMIPQISVIRHCQGNGLGSALLKTYFGQARKRGLKHLTLSVSEANPRAYQLYQRLGFRKLKDFHAFIKDPVIQGKNPA